MDSVIFRMAEQEDAQDILDIYAPYITDTTITFEYEIPSLEAFRARMAEIRREYPYLICEIDGRMAGYAYAHRYAERAAYQWDAELSVYLAPRYAGRGIGRALYQALMEILKLQNVKTVYGLVTSPNPPSEALHYACGFHLQGIMSKTGFKLGEWIDVSCFEKEIGSRECAPEPFLPVSCVKIEQIHVILHDAEKEDKKIKKRS